MPIRHLHGNARMLSPAGRSVRVGEAGCQVHLLSASWKGSGNREGVWFLSMPHQAAGEAARAGASTWGTGQPALPSQQQNPWRSMKVWAVQKGFGVLDFSRSQGERQRAQAACTWQVLLQRAQVPASAQF